MKKLILLLIIFSTFSLFAQIPANYYDSANGLSGYALKSELHSIISNGHSDQGYDALYDGYVSTDSDNYYENDGSVLDMYSENPSGTDPYFYTHGDLQCGNYSGEYDCYNREHIVPQSVFSEQSPMKADIHFVVPSDGYVNGRRSNYAFGEVTNASWTSQNGSKVGSNTYGSYTGTVFEPIDEFKGDIARMLFYFATRYETQVDSWSHTMFNGTEDQVFADWFLDMLLEWHTNDPVSTRETDRNTAAYNYQGNANPFLDHPEWVNIIWNSTPDTEVPSTPNNLIVSNETSSSFLLTWDAAVDNIEVTAYDIYKDDSFEATTSNTNYQLTGLTPLTSYDLYVIAKDAANNESTASTTIIGTTTNSGSSGVATELFFSEYVEGSSNNKALEIANYTANTISLSNYSVARNANGSGGWGTPVSLIGNLASNDVFVIANGSAVLLMTPDQLSSQDPLLFNGNDPVGLFKDGILIDIIGVLDAGSADFAIDVTLRRKAEINNPNTTFDFAGEWDSYPQDTFDGLGTHILPTPTFEFLDFSIYPNPNDGYFIIKGIDFPENMTIQIFSIQGTLVFQQTYSSENIPIQTVSLNTGLYLVYVKTKDQIGIQKLIIK